MKILLFGLGSIGQRHARNLMGFEPDAHLIIADPFAPAPGGSHLFYRSWHMALDHHHDASAAIIASPHDCHLEQLEALADRRIPALLEKPVCSISQTPEMRAVVERCLGLKVACGFQYRFHHEAKRINALTDYDTLRFGGQDDLVKRYGPTIGEVMVSHPIDTALRLFGPAAQTQVQNDGVHFQGKIVHRNGKESFFDYRMDTGPRTSYIDWGRGRLDLGPDEEAYALEMDAFLLWAVHGHEKDERLAVLSDGVEVQNILARSLTTGV